MTGALAVLQSGEGEEVVDEFESSAGLMGRETLGGYRLLNELGRGGMGIVFRAQQKRPERMVALKVIAHGELASPRAIERFHAETTAVARLDHPNIASIYEVGADGNWHYFSMRFIDGETLAARLLKGSLEPREAAQLFVTIARATHHAHQRGVLHRDIKPTNIILDKTGEPHLTDFGLAKILEFDSSLTHTNAILGTPAYMPPEQASGQTADVTTAADVYSLGAVFYQMLAGKPPFEGETVPKMLRMIAERDAPAPSIARGSPNGFPSELDVICLKCLEKDPKARYASASELADDVERWLRGEPILAQPASVAARASKWIRRNPALSGLLAVTGASLLAGLIGLAIFSFQMNSAKEEADARLASKHLADSSTLMANGNAFAAALALTEVLEPGRHGAASVERAQFRLDRIFDLSPRLLRLRTFHDIPKRFDFAENGELFITLRDGKRLKWELATDHLIDAGAGEPLPVVVAKVSSDGALKLRYDSTNGVVIFDDLKAGTNIAMIPVNGPVFDLDFSPDGKLFGAAIFRDQALIYGSDKGRPLGPRFLHESGANRARFSPDGQMFVTAGFDYNLRVHLTGMWKTRGPSMAHGALVEALAFSPDGRFLAAGDANGVAQVWDLAPATRIFAPGGPDSRLTAWSRDSGRLTVADGGQLRVIDAASGKDIASFNLPAPPAQVSFLGPGESVVAACRTAGARIWNVATGEEIALDFDATGAVNSPDGGSIAFVSGEKIRIWNVSNRKWEGTEFAHSEPVAFLYWSGDGRWISTASAHAGRVWNARIGAPVGDVIRAPAGCLIDDCLFSPDGSRLIVAFSNLAIEPAYAQLYELPTMKTGPRLPHGDGISFVNFSPDSKLALTGGEDNAARVWNPATGAMVAPALRHAGIVRSMSFHADAKMLASVGPDGFLRFWDFQRGELAAPPWLTGRSLKKVRMLPNGSTVFVAATEERWIYQPKAERLSAENYQLLAESHSGLRLNPAHGFTALAPNEWESRFEAALAAMPHRFAWPTNMAEWHSENAYTAERSGNAFAAEFHKRRLAALGFR